MDRRILTMMTILVLGLILIGGCKKNDTIKPIKTDGTPTGGEDAQIDDGTTDTADNTTAVDGQTTDDTPKVTTGNKGDLEVSDLYWNSLYPEPGATIELKAKVKNVGIEAIDGFNYYVKVSKDGAMWKEETLSSDATLYPGNSTVLKSEYTVPKGDYTAQIYVDNKNDIKELNEFNNVLETKATSRAMIIVQPARDTSDDSSSDDEEE
ncbi:MAG TPA: CARDB domain-containing protein [Candidatus Nanoarchaeia archaeon]|nr:CARDB domain-containing protein [Candidatus Nanoarchaeia archaeon]